MLNEIASFINSKVTGANATANQAEVGDGHVLVNSAQLFDAVKALKESEEFDINVLQVVSGVDYENHIEVNYMLASFTKNSEFILKVKLDKKSSDDVPEVPSLTSLYRSADFLEREVYDMNGVRFLNHHDHRRILCPEDWEGYPLRRDYKVQKEWAGLEVNPEHKVNSADHNFYKEIVERMGGDEKKVTYSWSGAENN